VERRGGFYFTLPTNKRKKKEGKNNGAREFQFETDGKRLVRRGAPTVFVHEQRGRDIQRLHQRQPQQYDHDDRSDTDANDASAVSGDRRPGSCAAGGHQ
jgi:hypothetical protein